MSDGFFRFPQTPHVEWLGAGAPRDDKLMSSAEVGALLAGPVVVEEKLDGANLGFSVGADGVLRAQNRGQYLSPPFGGQFQRLTGWLALHGDGLAQTLGANLVAFGEWCAARHSLDYPMLPDWWLMFDVYDRREGRFWSTRRRDTLATEQGLATVPRVAAGTQTPASLQELVASSCSRFRDGSLEGIVVRAEDSDWLRARGKLVRQDFTQAIESHWRSRALQWNQVDWGTVVPEPHANG